VGTRERRERSNASDNKLAELFRGALSITEVVEDDVALAAVGGFGRGELAPGSDLDILILHTGLSEKVLGEFVNALLYPLWSSGAQVDYSVRTRKETAHVSAADVKVILGLLDIRHIIGNSDLTEEVAEDAKVRWSKEIRKYLPALSASISERAERSGELAFLLEPDLKEARGGLRDINALRAISESQLVDVALDRVAASEALISNARDTLHQITGRGRDQLLLTEQDAVAAKMGFADADVLMLEISKAARAVDYVMQLTWHRINQRSKRRFFKGKSTTAIAKGIASYQGEVILVDEEGKNDAGLGLRAAAFAAQRGLRLSVETAMSISENYVPLTTPWPRQTREDLVALIGAGEAMVDVFEALDQEGLIERWIPEWSHVRFLPQRNVLHHHTVDRHMLETAVKAAALTRSVHRPDLLLVAALFHDIGKGYADKDHSEYGEELILPLAARLGFEDEDCQTIALMVKHHLLLSSVATRRDLDDPQTIAYVLSLVSNAQLLELLHALSIADGEATGRAAWTDWKATLVNDLVKRCLSAMQGIEPAPEPELTSEQIAKAASGELSVVITPHNDVLSIEIVSPDRPGLLSLVAAALSVSRMDVRSARTRSIENSAVMNWLVTIDVSAPYPDADKMHELISRALDGDIDLDSKIADRIAAHRRTPGIAVPPPVVSATNNLATGATIVEVRMHDQPGILYTLSKVIASFGADIRGAIVATLGAEAFDTIYVADLAGGALSNERAAALVLELEEVLNSSSE